VAVAIFAEGALGRNLTNVYQSRIEAGKPPQKYLLRVFVDVDREPPDVVTAYRTSKIDKYWRADK
jgi:hypothetical protein